MKNYQHLFFDLDGTLWDLKKNTRIALEQLFEQYSAQLSSVDFNFFYKRYHHHNDQVWTLYRKGEITKEVLRYVRFERAFSDSGTAGQESWVKHFADEFMEICPRLPHTLDGAHELLDYCKDRFTLHIITNGFSEVQGHKMRAARLESYFTEVINSEQCGYRKPHPRIFEYALERSSAQTHHSLMIGDDWDADILGARDFGMDQAFITTTEDLLNEIHLADGMNEIRHNYKATYTINDLRELITILEEKR